MQARACASADSSPRAARPRSFERRPAHWTKLSLGPQRLLGDFHSAGLPKNDIGNAMPICSDAWGDVDKAWRRMTEHLTEFIAHQLFGPGSRMPAAQAALPATGAGLPVTYFCDQLHATGDFDNVLDSHHHQQHPDQRVHALLAIVQGQYDDNPDMFVNRLHAHHLSHRLQALGLSIDPIRRPMEWPMHSNAADTFAGKTAVRQLFGALDSRLSVALARCTTMAHASTALRDHLARDDTKARVVFALLPDRSARCRRDIHPPALESWEPQRLGGVALGRPTSLVVQLHLRAALAHRIRLAVLQRIKLGLIEQRPAVAGVPGLRPAALAPAGTAAL